MLLVSILGYALMIALCAIPLILFLRNYYFTFKRPHLTEEEHLEGKYGKVSENVNDFLIVFFGAFCSYLWTSMLLMIRVMEIDYDEPAYKGYLHFFLHSQYSITVIITLCVAAFSFLILNTADPEKLPPVPQALCFAFSAIGEIVLVFIIAQLMMNTSIMIFPVIFYLANLIMLTGKYARRYITAHLRYKQVHETVYRTKFAEILESKLNTFQSMTSFHFMMLLPAALILIILFIIFGQGPDGIIKAFTMTADWTFSTQTPPPPIDYEGHYLCTVAAGGHKKVVKPVRYGKRRGETIVVNRQLLASNAFEDLIMEKTPKFHRTVRRFYDRHGYPISRHITTQTRADIVYFIMKPLEWLFILFLYTFDAHPENRIAVQYSDYKKSKIATPEQK